MRQACFVPYMLPSNMIGKFMNTVKTRRLVHIECFGRTKELVEKSRLQVPVFDNSFVRPQRQGQCK